MPQITVQALVTGPDGVLLVRERGAAEWRLPGGPLLETDESVEDAVIREVRTWLSLTLEEEPLFLDTLYERSAEATVVHNIFHLPDPSAFELPPGLESRWLVADALGETKVADWLRRGLEAAFGGEVEPEFDLGQLEAAFADRRETAPVIVVTGPAGAGKSTVARELCRRFPRAAHISADLLRAAVVSGYASPIPGQSDPDWAAQQNRLVVANATAIARNFVAEGFVAVIDEVLEGTEGLDAYLDALGPFFAVHVITLLPDAATLVRRDAQRPAADQMGARCEELRRIIAANGESRGIRLDTSAWTVEETIDIILARLSDAHVEQTMEDLG